MRRSGPVSSQSDIEFEQVGTAKPAPSGEETLDTGWASSMAPGSIVRVYATGTLAFTALGTGLEAILADTKNGTPIQQLSISQVFAKPSWQYSLSYPRRAVPDVAAVGDPQTGVIIILDGQQEEVGGTSASTPIWAGLMALVNQGRLQAGSPSLGLLPPRLYQLAGTANLRDVTKGSNGGHKAGIGYDLTTGLGSPVMSQLFYTLLNQP